MPMLSCFEPTPIFPPSTQYTNSVQHVLPVPLIEYFVSSTSDNRNTVQNPSEPSSPHLITYQHSNQMTCLVPQGESSLVGPSQSSLNTTTPNHDDSLSSNSRGVL